MSNEQMRIAIAEACGWRITSQIRYSWVVISPSNMEVAWSSQAGEINDKPASSYLPDYLNDLNAMHEAEKVLTHDQQVQFSVELGKLTTSHLPSSRAAWVDFTIAHATARQRAEAFLKAIGKWEE